MATNTNVIWNKHGKAAYFVNGKPATYFAHAKANKEIYKKYGDKVVWSVNDKVATKCEYNLAKIFKPNSQM